MWKCEAIVLASRIALCSKAATATAGGFLAGRGNQLPLGRSRELSGTQRGVQRAQITHCTYKSRGARAMPNTRAKTLSHLVPLLTQVRVSINVSRLARDL